MARALRARLIVLGLISVVALIVAGTEYVGIPQRYFGGSYVVSVNLPDSGGIFPNAEVTDRGVAIGRVASLHLTADGVRADLRINRGTRIPVDTFVKVSNLSAVGEQYINLLPQSSSGPYLSADGALPVSAATTPVQVTQLLVHLDQLATSIGKPQLHTLVTELGRAFEGSTGDLGTVLDQADRLTRDLSSVQPQTVALLKDSGGVLKTQVGLRSSLKSFSTSLDQLTATLAGSDPELRSLVDRAPVTVTDLAGFLTDNQANVSVLLGNLLSTSQIVAAPVRLRGTNTILVLLPRLIQETFNIQQGDGYTRLGVVVDTSQKVCTQGYQSSGTSPVQSTSPSSVPGDPSLRANVNAYCASPPSSGIDVRGAANAPRPPGDTTARPLPQANPRGYGPGSSFRNTSGTSTSGLRSTSDAQPPLVHVVGPTDLSGLLLKGSE